MTDDDARLIARLGKLDTCAVSDALGGHMFNRVPVVADMIVNVVAKRPQSYKPLQVNNQ